MHTARTLVVVALGVACAAHTLRAQGRSQYREFQLGADLASVAALAKVAAPQAKIIHLRPAVIQRLEWRPPYFMSESTAPQNDPVQLIVFSFYNDQLFKMVIDYDRRRTEGLTDADLVEAISASYGSPLKPTVKRPLPVDSQVAESGTPVARWGDADSSVVLYRSSYTPDFRVIVTSPRLEALARTADAQAIRSDEREAPQRGVARQKKAAEDTRVSQANARLANKAAFRP